MNEDQQEILALAIIKNEKFADAYQLCKVLAWKFDVINCSEIIGRVEGKSIVVATYPKTKKLKFFSLTDKGSIILQENLDQVFNILKSEFPDKIEFIDNLFSFL